MPGAARYRVLLVDGDPASGETAAALLAEVGLLVTAVEDGAQALEEVAAWRFDLIVADVAPAQDAGVELVTALRQAAPTTPLIAIAPATAEPLLAKAKGWGLTSVLIKPVVRARFLTAVAEALSADRP